LAYLKDMERKLRQMVLEWKKEEDKNKVVKQWRCYFQEKRKAGGEQKAKAAGSKYAEVGGDIKVGDKVKMKRNQQVGEVLELRGKRAVVKIGLLPMQFDMVIWWWCRSAKLMCRKAHNTFCCLCRRTYFCPERWQSGRMRRS
jgi:DNA mismatch repair protein MutS2